MGDSPRQAERDRAVLLVVFGAGASYDSAHSRPAPSGEVDTAPDRPPLANNLFDERVSDNLLVAPEPYPHREAPLTQLLGLFSRLRSREPDETVEAVLQRLYAERDIDPRRYQQLAAVRYYLNQTLWRITERWRETVTLEQVAAAYEAG
jgi:hypothetical protein